MINSNSLNYSPCQFTFTFSLNTLIITQRNSTSSQLQLHTTHKHYILKKIMTKIKLTIEYVGTDFCGWQSQTNGNSVQDAVERALGKYFDCDFVRIYAAGRTDVGVHAKGQVAHFTVDNEVNPFKLCLGVNLALPKSIAVTNAEIVQDDFDARFSALSKTYCYRIYVSPVRRPTLDVNHTQVYKTLNVGAMKQAAELLVGNHDFAAFQNTGSNLKGTVRTINFFKLEEKSDGVIEFIINGNAFLYNQVRNMCGLLVEVGKGKYNIVDVEKSLDGVRLQYKTLPAKGLTLERVFY